MALGLPSVLLSDRGLRYSRGRLRSTFFRPSVEHGVSDSAYPHTIARTQLSKAFNFDLSKDGFMETRGGSIKITDTDPASTGSFPTAHIYTKRETDGTITRKRMMVSGTVLYEYNTSTGVWDSKQTGLATDRVSMVNFVNAAGTDVMLLADGNALYMYDGSSVSNITANFTAGSATQAPRYLLVKHNVCFAAGDDANPDVLFWCDPLKPNSDWPSNGFALLEGGLDKITGISELYNYVIVGCLNSIYMVTGRISATFALFKVNNDQGTTSHWSMVSQGGYVYFANSSGFFIGKLRAAEDDGMDVEYISQNMQRTFSNIVAGFWDNIQGTYHDGKQAIYWTVRTGSNSHPDKLFVYSVIRSQPVLGPPEFGPDLRYVWAGYYTGINWNSITVQKDSNGKDELYAIDNNGTMYLLHSEFKDKRAVGESVAGTDVSYEIRTRAETFGGRGVTARVMEWFPTLYQKHNGAFSVQFLIDSTELFPASPINIKFTGNIPYWHDGTDDQISATWNGSLWVGKPILNAKLSLAKKCYAVIAIITADGSNTKEEGTWVGYDMLYQRDPIPQGKAT